MATIALTKDTFEETTTGDGLTLVDFWAEWCGPCRQFAPVYEKAAEKHSDITFAKVDTEAEQELAGGFNITSIPTLMVIKDNVIIYAQPGALPEQALESLIEQARAVDMDEVRAKIAEEDAAAAEN